VALEGEMALSVGTRWGGWVIVKVRAVEVPPPEGGLNTVTWTVPADAMSVPGRLAVNFVALTNVVVRLLPFHCTTDAEIKFVPFTVSVNAAPPAAALPGDKPLTAGAGLALVMVNVKAFEVPPPGAGLNTVTRAVPAAAILVAGIVAVSWVALTNVVVRLLPFHCTTEPRTKPEPNTVSVKPTPPAVALAGDREERIAGKVATVRVTETICEVTPAAEIVIVPLYVPAARPAGATDTVRGEGAVPDVGVTLNHEALKAALQVSVPPPLLVICSDCPGGIVPPTV
jgi:hypothetical protein